MYSKPISSLSSDFPLKFFLPSIFTKYSVLSNSILIWWNNIKDFLTKIFSYDQAALSMVLYVQLSVCPSVTPFSQCSFHCIIMKLDNYHWQQWCPCRSEALGHCQRGQNIFCPNSGIFGLQLCFDLTNGYKIMHKAWNGTEEVPYYFSRSHGTKNHQYWLELSIYGP